MADKTFIISSSDGGTTWSSDYENEDAPLPVELIRIGDVSPLFAAVANPNKILRSSGGAWEELDDPLTVGGGSDEIASLAYDFVSDRLFVSYIGTSVIFGLKTASEVDVAQANAAALAVADTLLDEGVEGYWQRIPSTDQPPVSYRQLVSSKKART